MSYLRKAVRVSGRCFGQLLRIRWIKYFVLFILVLIVLACHQWYELIMTNDSGNLRLRQMEADFYNRRMFILDQIEMLEKEINKRSYGYLPFSSITKQLTSGMNLSKETEIMPFEFYNQTHLMTTHLAAGGKPAFPVEGRRKVDFGETIAFVEKVFASNSKLKPQLVSCLHRTVPTLGDIYEVLVGFCAAAKEYSAKREYAERFVSKGSLSKVTVVRPFEPLALVSLGSVAPTTHIEMVLCLNSTRAFALTRLIKELEKTMNEDSMLSLTVLYSGDDIRSIRKLLNSGSIRLKSIVQVNRTSGHLDSLRRALQDRNQDRGDSLLFFTDVNLVVRRGAFRRCRYHAVRKHSVYYPIIFGLYDPDFIYPRIYKTKIPNLETQLVIDDNRGRWRVEYYGASCQHKSDFMKAMNDPRGELQTGEKLFQKYLHAGYMAYRIPDPDIFHLYRRRQCVQLPGQLFWKCILYKIHYTGQHAHMPFLIQ